MTTASRSLEAVTHICSPPLLCLHSKAVPILLHKMVEWKHKRRNCDHENGFAVQDIQSCMSAMKG